MEIKNEITKEIDKAQLEILDLKTGKQRKRTSEFIKYHEGYIHGLKKVAEILNTN